MKQDADVIDMNVKANGRQGRRLAVAIPVGFCAVAAFVLLFSPLRDILASGSPGGGFVILEDERTPLAAFELYEIPAEYLPVIDSVSIQAGARDVQMALLNPEANDSYFIFEIILVDTGEILYISELLAPSMGVDHVTLIAPLEKGEYKAELLVRAFSLHQFAEIVITGVAFDLIVT